jgi:WD40 repeat protein
LRPADLKVFSDLPGRFRYLLWIDARGKSSLDTRSYPVGRPQRYQDPNSGVVWWGPPQWTHETSLSITDLSTTFMIWDLRTGETVWTCRISGTESLREKMTRPSDDARVYAAAGAHGTFEQMVERAVAALPP